MKAKDHHEGYVRYGIIIDGKVCSKLGHQLVAITFLGPQPSPYHIVNHKNGVKNDNRVENLEWVTHEENMNHASYHNLTAHTSGIKNTAAKLSNDDVKEIRESPLPTKIFIHKYNVSKEQINKIRRNEAWTHLLNHSDV